MTTTLTVYQGAASELTPVTIQDAITALADKWLATKAGRSGSVKTARAYRDALRSFRARLLEADLDLLLFTDEGKVNPPRRWRSWRRRGPVSRERVCTMGAL